MRMSGWISDNQDTHISLPPSLSGFRPSGLLKGRSVGVELTFLWENLSLLTPSKPCSGSDITDKVTGVLRTLRIVGKNWMAFRTSRDYYLPHVKFKQKIFWKYSLVLIRFNEFNKKKDKSDYEFVFFANVYLFLWFLFFFFLSYYVTLPGLM